MWKEQTANNNKKYPHDFTSSFSKERKEKYRETFSGVGRRVLIGVEGIPGG